MYKGTTRLTVDFAETTEARKQRDYIIQVVKEKITNQEFYTHQNEPTKMKMK